MTARKARLLHGITARNQYKTQLNTGWYKPRPFSGTQKHLLAGKMYQTGNHKVQTKTLDRGNEDKVEDAQKTVQISIGRADTHTSRK